jgi:AAHS family 4-hydroxybenzoate transporter-like MFS transporter
MAGSAASRTLDVGAFLGSLKITPFHRWLIFLSCLVTFFDGLDFALVSATLPYIRDEMGLTPTMMGLVSSAAFLGQMIGSLAG